MLYVLLPLALGIIFAKHCTVNVHAFLGWGGISIGSALYIVWKKRHLLWHRQVWLCLHVLGTFLIACTYTELRKAPQLPEDFESYHGNITLKIERLFKPLYKGSIVQGIGSIMTTPASFPYLKDQKMYFRIYQKEKLSHDRGTTLIVASHLVPIAEGTGDFEIFLEKENCSLKLYGTLIEAMDYSGAFGKRFAKGREHIKKILYLGAVSDQRRSWANVCVAMLLGDQKALSKDQRNAFRKSGVAHLFAVSGLHVGIIGAFLALGLRALGITGKSGALLGLGLLLLYVCLIQSPPSAIRAWLMACFLWGGIVFHRQAWGLSSLATSACVALLVYPFDLFSVGFQLSYTVVAGILLVGVPIGMAQAERHTPYAFIPYGTLRLHQRVFRKLFFSGVMLLAVSLSAGLFSAPLTIAYFNSVATLGFIANLLLVQMAATVLVMEVVAVAIGLLGNDLLTIYVHHLSWAFVACMEKVAETISAINIAQIDIAWMTPSIGLVVAIFMIGSAYCLPNGKWRSLWIPVGILLISVLCLTQAKEF